MNGRDVMAKAFDSMPGGELRGYDVADRFMLALDRVGLEIRRQEDWEESSFSTLVDEVAKVLWGPDDGDAPILTVEDTARAILERLRELGVELPVEEMGNAERG